MPLHVAVHTTQARERYPTIIASLLPKELAVVEYDLATLLATSASEVSNQGDWKAFSRRSREWALYGLLTTAGRRTQYRELATLMRQGTPTDEAVSQAFGTPLTELSKQFESGRWQREAQFKIPAPTSVPALPPAEALDAPSESTVAD